MIFRSQVFLLGHRRLRSPIRQTKSDKVLSFVSGPHLLGFPPFRIQFIHTHIKTKIRRSQSLRKHISHGKKKKDTFTVRVSTGKVQFNFTFQEKGILWRWNKWFSSGDFTMLKFNCGVRDGQFQIGLFLHLIERIGFFMARALSGISPLIFFFFVCVY